MKTIAIIGASNNHQKFGNKAVRAYLKRGWKVFPVNLTEDKIEGLDVYRNIKDIKDEVERISIYLPPEKTLNVLKDISIKNPKEIYFNPGSENDEVLNESNKLGLNTVAACSIVDIGEQPINYQ